MKPASPAGFFITGKEYLSGLYPSNASYYPGNDGDLSHAHVQFPASG